MNVNIIKSMLGLGRKDYQVTVTKGDQVLVNEKLSSIMDQVQMAGASPHIVINLGDTKMEVKQL